MKRLVLNSDDFGLCHSINLGVVKGFTEGLLTQASIMDPKVKALVDELGIVKTSVRALPKI